MVVFEPRLSLSGGLLQPDVGGSNNGARSKRYAPYGNAACNKVGCPQAAAALMHTLLSPM